MSQETLNAIYGNTKDGLYSFDPVAQMDCLRGFKVGSVVTNMTTMTKFICTDATVNAAVWEPIRANIARAILAGAKMMIIGDSITEYHTRAGKSGTNGYNTYKWQRGYWNWLRAMTGNPFQFDVQNVNGKPLVGANKGIAGETTNDVLARMRRDIVNENPDVVYINIGTNNLRNATKLDTIKNDILKLVRMAMSTGATVLLGTVLPRNNIGGVGFTSQRNTDRLTLNAWIRTLPTIFGDDLVIADFSAIETSDNLLPTTYSDDGVHPNSFGAYKIAKLVLVPLLKRLAGVSSLPRVYPGDYDASNDKYGNILTNSDFTGTSGTIGTGASGVCPDSWRLIRASGSTVTAVGSIVSRADWNGDTRNFLSVAYSAVGGGANPELFDARHYAGNNDTFTTTAAIGEWYRASVEVIIKPTSSGVNPLRSVYLRVQDSSGDTSVVGAFSPADTLDTTDMVPDEGEEIRLILQTDPLQCRGTTGFVYRFTADVDGTKTGSREVLWGKPVFERIPGPVLDAAPTRVIRKQASAAADFFVLPPRCVIDKIVVKNNTANAITGGLKFGTTLGGTDVISALTVGANAEVVTLYSAFAKLPFSTTAGQIIYYDAGTAWNSANVDMYILVKEI